MKNNKLSGFIDIRIIFKVNKFHRGAVGRAVDRSLVELYTLLTSLKAPLHAFS